METNLVLPVKNSGKKWRLVKANSYIYIMLLPVVIIYIIFNYIPMYGVLLAFKSYKGGGLFNFLFAGEWEGLKYFQQLMSDPLFFRALVNTVIISLMKIFIAFPFTIFLVIMLNEIKGKNIKKTVQTVIYLPHFLSWVVIGSVVLQFLGSEGAITKFMIMVSGNENISIMTDKGCFRWILLATTVFKEAGWDTVIYLAAIAGISPELYEAADMDGASRIGKIMNITLPCLLPTICTMLLIKISFMITGDFDQVYMLYNVSVYPTGDIIPTYIFRTGLSDGRFSLSTAMGLFSSVVSSVLLIGSNAISKKLTGEGVY